MTVTLYLID